MTNDKRNPKSETRIARRGVGFPRSSLIRRSSFVLRHSCALLAAVWFYCPLASGTTGNVVAWGAGQTSPPPGLNNVIAISSSLDHTLALRSDGTVVAWGFDFDGQCDVPAGLNNVVAVAAGEFFSLALKSDGTVVGWG